MNVTVNAWYSYEYPGKFTANLDELGRPPLHADSMVELYRLVRTTAKDAFPYDDVDLRHHIDWENIHANTVIVSRKVKSA